MKIFLYGESFRVLSSAVNQLQPIMKLQEFAAKYNLSLNRACLEILVPNGHKSRKFNGRVSFLAVCRESQKTPELKKIAKAYAAMKGMKSYVRIQDEEQSKFAPQSIA